MVAAAAHNPMATPPLVGAEDGGDGGERGREDQRRAGSGHHAGGEELPGCGRARPQGQGGDEDDEAGEHVGFAAEAVTERPGREGEGGQHQGVAMDDPLQVRLAGPDGDVRKGEVEARHDRHQQDRQAHGDEHDAHPAGRPPARALRSFGSSLLARPLLGAYDNDLWQFNLVVRPATPLLAKLAVCLVALISQWPGLRAVNRLDVASVVRLRSA